VIVKTGADLRQEQLAVQLIREFGRIWQDEKCGCWVRQSVALGQIFWHMRMNHPQFSDTYYRVYFRDCRNDYGRSLHPFAEEG
jgi:hypothetical protein